MSLVVIAAHGVPAEAVCCGCLRARACGGKSSSQMSVKQAIQAALPGA